MENLTILTKLEILKKKKEENKIRQEKIKEENKNLKKGSNKQIGLLNIRKLAYMKMLERAIKPEKIKEKQLILEINKLRKETGIPLSFKILDEKNLKSRGESEKEKKYYELIKKYKDTLNSQEKLYETPRQNIENLDRQIKEINKKIFGLNKDFQNKIFELKKEEKSLNEEINSLEKN